MTPITRGLRSPTAWFVVAAVAVVGVGTAVGSTDMAKKKAQPVFNKKQTSRIVSISRAQANARITARAPGLSVASARNADAAKAADSAKTAESATVATTAQNLAGTTHFTIRMSWGETRTIATNGPVSMVAQCAQDVGGQNRVRILAATTATGSFLQGFQSQLGGPGISEAYLEPSTPEDARQIVRLATTAAGQPGVARQIDIGFVAGPDGTMLRVNSESIVLGLNAFGANCFLKGEVLTN